MFLLNILFWVFVLAFIIFYGYYKSICFEYKTVPRITYKQFIQWYAIAPTKWKLGGAGAMYKRGTYYTPWQETVFKNFFEFCRYEIYYVRHLRTKTQRRRTNNMIEMVKEIQGDIDRYKKEHNIDISNSAG